MFNTALILELRQENAHLRHEVARWQAEYQKLVDRLLAAQGVPETPIPPNATPTFDLWEEEEAESYELEDNRKESEMV